MIGFYDAVRDRLADRCDSSIGSFVTGMSSADIDSLALSEAVTVLVLPLGETAAPVREASFKVSQRETVRFGALLALAFPGGFSQFEPARDAIKAALRGWLPADFATPVQYSGGRLLRYDPRDGGQWLHLLEFSVTTQTTYEAQE